MIFFKGKICCHWSTNGVGNGNSKYVHRYLYRSCEKSLYGLTNSSTYRSKKTLDKWLRYDKCMLNSYFIRKSDEDVEITYFALLKDDLL